MAFHSRLIHCITNWFSINCLQCTVPPLLVLSPLPLFMVCPLSYCLILLGGPTPNHSLRLISGATCSRIIDLNSHSSKTTLSGCCIIPSKYLPTRLWFPWKQNLLIYSCILYVLCSILHRSEDKNPTIAYHHGISSTYHRAWHISDTQ